MKLSRKSLVLAVLFMVLVTLAAAKLLSERRHAATSELQQMGIGKDALGVGSI